MRVESVRTVSLGDTSYVVVHEGFGVVIDPQRDLSRFRDAVEQLEVVVTHVFDTHIHNDYLSGAPALADEFGADLVLPAGSGAAFPFVAAFHHEDIEGPGSMTVRPIHTPGHTPEHCSYLVSIDGVPSALFSGGSLLVGSAGRCDLLGDAYAESLARLQYGSVNRLGDLPDDVDLYPTHGAGSFCTASTAGGTSSTIGTERRSNRALAYPDAEGFVAGELTGLLPYPDYYPSMAPINRAGPRALDEREVAMVGPDDIDPAAWVIDLRPRETFAAGHLAGSLSIEEGSSFAPWVGWLVPFGAPVHVVVGPDRDPRWAAIELGRIGYSVIGATDDLTGADLIVGRTADHTEAAEALANGALVVDVRDPIEWETAHAEGTVHRYVPDLRDGIPGDRDEVWVVCASGFRASIAAGLVERAGRTVVAVTSGGVDTLLRDHPELARPAS